ncbi:MAG: choice-of-anchor D domain-containing protein [Candidatus Latescibacteria bacterium]|jgi:P pilus assembly chaperone PapD|nr:choice-of-anchor D domain-containing protein [Candidatus Latescibacterota bacterium]MBT4139560.1 choice-of-anchor D domain-containing protein [Candidatus Latescibacterota bacterium]MBT5830169.1 choice-of-anchor D domain-containing protein [Candidatus Latescibacterota bacterium]
MAAGPAFEADIYQINKDNPNVQMMVLDTYNGTPAQAESYRLITGVSAPILRQASDGTDYAGARLEDILVVDQENVVRLWLNAAGTDEYPQINQMITALVNKNPVISLSSRQIYFGTQINAGTTTTANIRVENTGDGPLEITGYSAPSDIVIEPAQFTVNKNETQTVKITYTPTQIGTFTGTIELEHNNNAVDKLQVPIRDITVEGSISPSIVLGQESLDFGQTELTKSNEKTITIRNDGPGTLNVSNIQTDNPDISIPSTQFSIPAGSAIDITIIYKPQTETTLSGTLNVLSDDPDKGTLSIALSGSGIFIPADPRADFNGSGVVDFPDFLSFVQAFGTPDATFDLNDNGQVDFPDFLTFVQSFGKSVN